MKSSANRKRVCMVTHSYYESDNRVMRYAQTLAERGDEVEVAALRRGPEVPKAEVIEGVKVFRIQNRFGKREQSKFSYLWPLFRFLLVSCWWITRRHWRERYHLIHIHNIPAFLVFAAWYPKLTGAKIVLDIHDIEPEFFASKFKVSDSSLLVKALKFAEKASAMFADHVILANHLWLEKFVSRSGRKERCSVFINNVDARIFRPATAREGTTKPVILFPGGLQWHQGLDIAVRAFARLRSRLPGAEFHIYGDGNMKPSLMQLSADLGLNGSVRFFQPLRIQEIAGVMAQANLGVVPKRADTFGNEAYSTKIMEFMALGVPVVVSNTKVDRYYFDESVVRFFESGNDEALAQAMLEVLSNDDLRRGLVARATQYAAQNSWDNRKTEYLCLADSLCG